MNAYADTSFVISWFVPDANHAAARLLGAREFWTFDQRQRALAQAAGLKVGP